MVSIFTKVNWVVTVLFNNSCTYVARNKRVRAWLTHRISYYFFFVLIKKKKIKRQTSRGPLCFSGIRIQKTNLVLFVGFTPQKVLRTSFFLCDNHGFSYYLLDQLTTRVLFRWLWLKLLFLDLNCLLQFCITIQIWLNIVNV